MATSFLYKVKKTIPLPIFAVLFVSSIGAYKTASNKKGGTLTYKNTINKHVLITEFLFHSQTFQTTQAHSTPQQQVLLSKLITQHTVQFLELLDQIKRPKPCDLLHPTRNGRPRVYPYKSQFMQKLTEKAASTHRTGQVLALLVGTGQPREIGTNSLLHAKGQQSLTFVKGCEIGSAAAVR